MNKSAIKNFAIWARVQLIEAAKQRAFEYEITENGENKANVDSIGGRLLSVDEKEQRKQLIVQIQRKGYSQVMEEAAYTWFNRFIALRFMEVNGYLPSKVRVFTDENGMFKPEILKEAMSVELDGLDRSKVLDLLDKQDNETLYKYLLITQCNALNTGLPYMFEKIANWSELLFPVNLLRSDSVVARMVSDIPEEDWTDAVQIIGWMYQYYNTELKDDTFALLKKNVKISKERIPAATQLFTPDWIVRYMVENSLGRLWYEGHSDFDKSQWKYYLDETDQEPEVEAQLKKIRVDYANIRPEEIKVIDPCMGSGHILVYAFDVLMEIYTSAGWSERDAAKSILENNLYGLDIDDRAGQLAYFAVMMKARKYSRRILNGEVNTNVFAIQDSSFMTDEFIAYVAGKDYTMKADLTLLRSTFKDAKEYGSIMNVKPLNNDALYKRIDIISRSFAEDLFQMQYQVMAKKELLALIRQSQVMSQKYDVVVTNPPYMGAANMSPVIAEFLRNEFPNSKSDLFSAFIEKGKAMLKINGLQAMITMQSWMFLSSYEVLRKTILMTSTVESLLHLGIKAFEEIGNDIVQTCAFVLRNAYCNNHHGFYFRLLTHDRDEKERQFLSRENLFTFNQKEYFEIPGQPIAYWIGRNTLKAFSEFNTIGDISEPKQGIATADNNRFLRLWSEVAYKEIGFGIGEGTTAASSPFSWFPYQKGGDFRKWYGNNNYVVLWKNNGYELKHFKSAVIRNPEYQLREGLSWTWITTGYFGARYSPTGSVFDVAGSTLFANKSLYFILAFMCSNVADYLVKIINPTINFSNGVISKLPVKISCEEPVSILAKRNVEISKCDWDSFETSWDFKKHPLI